MARAGTRPKARRITGGVDTHSQTHHTAVLLMYGSWVADAQFPATREGYAQLLAWMRSFGRLHSVGFEGTGSYGAGLTRDLQAEKISVVEVNQPDRRQRRAEGKSDPLDAYAAAGAVLSGRASAIPKAGDGVAEAIRALPVTRAEKVKARTAAINELRNLLVTAPAGLREQLAIAACARLRPAGNPAAPGHATKTALRSLARRYQALTAEAAALENQLAVLVRTARPGLTAIGGVGTETAAQLLIICGDNLGRLRSEAAFAALCGVSPIPASSGKTSRHRLSRGGDRRANRALYMIILGRLAFHASSRGS